MLDAVIRAVLGILAFDVLLVLALLWRGRDR